MAHSLEQVGRTADARREYQQYLELAPAAADADTVKAHLQSLGPS
jgi:Flp pilus assembly protein TadD